MSIVSQQSPLAYDSYIEQYGNDDDFKYVYEFLLYGSQTKVLNYHVHDKLLYHLDKFCIPQVKELM